MTCTVLVVDWHDMGTKTGTLLLRRSSRPGEENILLRNFGGAVRI